MDGELKKHERKKFILHLEQCDTCKNKIEEMKTIDSKYDQLLEKTSLEKLISVQSGSISINNSVVINSNLNTGNDTSLKVLIQKAQNLKNWVTRRKYIMNFTLITLLFGLFAFFHIAPVQAEHNCNCDAVLIQGVYSLRYKKGDLSAAKEISNYVAIATHDEYLKTSSREDDTNAGFWGKFKFKFGMTKDEFENHQEKHKKFHEKEYGETAYRKQSEIILEKFGDENVLDAWLACKKICNAKKRNGLFSTIQKKDKKTFLLRIEWLPAAMEPNELELRFIDSKKIFFPKSFPKKIHREIPLEIFVELTNQEVSGRISIHYKNGANISEYFPRHIIPVDRNEIPGFEYLGEKTYSCAGQVHTVKEYIHKKTGLEFIDIPGKNYMIAKYELTQEIWRNVMNTTPWKNKTTVKEGHSIYVKEGDKYPAVCMTWYEAKDFARKVGLSLPTSEEWEYACRAGSVTKYYWGNSVDEKYLWYNGNTYGRGNPHIQRIGEKEPNAFGLHDMIGGVFEWCDSDFINEKTRGKVHRGGAWNSNGLDITTSERIIGHAASYYEVDIGMRLCYRKN